MDVSPKIQKAVHCLYTLQGKSKIQEIDSLRLGLYSEKLDAKFILKTQSIDISFHISYI